MDQTGLSVTEKRLFRKFIQLADQINENRDLRNVFRITHEQYDKQVRRLLQEMARTTSESLRVLVAVETALVAADLNYSKPNTSINATGVRPGIVFPPFSPFHTFHASVRA